MAASGSLILLGSLKKAPKTSRRRLGEAGFAGLLPAWIRAKDSYRTITFPRNFNPMLPIDHIPLDSGAMVSIDHMIIDVASDFGRAIYQRRHEVGLTQDELAGVTGLNRRVVGQLERGKRTVRLDIAVELARSLGLEIELRPRDRG